jgi:hypothetical protein
MLSLTSEGLEAKQHIVILVNIELGYVAAPLAFSLDTEEVVLTVNGIRKVNDPGGRLYRSEFLTAYFPLQ